MKPSFNQENLWGIDFGGTKIEGVILLSAKEPEVIFRYRVETQSHLGYEHILGQFHKLFSIMVAEAGYSPSLLGVGSPGTYIPQKRQMKNCNAIVVNGQPFKEDLQRVLGVDIILANDANCFALAETKLGVVNELYPDAEVVFGVILGTGVGGGVVVRGEIINGKHGIGGEWGHNLLDKAGDLCYCGKNGCNEQMISGPALEKYYHRLSGRRKTLREIALLAEVEADPDAVKTIFRLTDGFAKALSVVVNIIDPDVIVLGGGVSNIENIYKDSLLTLNKMVFNNSFDAPLVKAKLGDSAGVFGAALLVAKEKSVYEEN
ncbi:sugar kinase [Echinicola pacifica]|uniref:Sugar kinase n=1 Tax=Echinicola pacifica TaxID=346377 RepID=A0A918PJZ5_9BACT|nr:ROK family protein [Echinicola pacifica]GGZ13575.1 sugar kinase [Echinicola pacifica]